MPPKAASAPAKPLKSAKRALDIECPPERADARRINLALQGGGAHGAFTWGVLDRLLEVDGLFIEGISSTSAGAVNGAMMTYGLITGGREEARRLLNDLWHRISLAAFMLPLKPTFVDRMMGMMNLDYSPGFMTMDYLTRLFSPYQLNILDINPLRSILEEMIDFEVIRTNNRIKLFVNATNVRTGKIKVFDTPAITLDSVMASACLPFVFKTVEIDGEAYWDGGYSGNPAIFPLIYNTSTEDVVIVQINPLSVEEVPTRAASIIDRINEISFNATLMREMRAIAFVSKLLGAGRLSDETHKNMRIHMIEAQDIMTGLGQASKLNADWGFLTHLRDVGRQAADEWLGRNFEKIGKESSIDIEEVFL